MKIVIVFDSRSLIYVFWLMEDYLIRLAFLLILYALCFLLLLGFKVAL